MAIKGRGGKSGGRAVKAVDLTSGDMRRVSGLETERSVRIEDRGAGVSRGRIRRSALRRRPERWQDEILGAALQADGGTRSAFAASSIRRRSVSHGPFCRTRRISQGNKYLHRGRHGQDRAGSEGGKRAGSFSAGFGEPRLSLQTDWIGSRAAVAVAVQRSRGSGLAGDLC